MADQYNSNIAALVGKLNKVKGGYAVTISSTCTLYSVPPEKVSLEWRRHEDCHKAQIKALGWIAFMRQYALQSAKFGYQNNKFEVEARAAAGEP